MKIYSEHTVSHKNILIVNFERSTLLYDTNFKILFDDDTR